MDPIPFIPKLTISSTIIRGRGRGTDHGDDSTRPLSLSSILYEENRDKMVMAMMVQRQGYRRRSNLPIFHFHGEGIDEVIQRSTWRKRR